MKSLRVNTPAEAFDLHTKLIEWRKRYPHEDKLLHHGYYKAMVGELGMGTLTRSERKVEYEVSQAYHNVARETDSAILSHADTVFLSDELRELVNTAEATMPDEVVFATDIYTPCGFIVMETPIHTTILSRVNAQDLDELTELVQHMTGSVTGIRKGAKPDENGDYIGIEHWEVQAYAWADISSIKGLGLARIGETYGMESVEYQFARDIFLALRSEETGFFVRVYGTLVSTEIDGITLESPEMQNSPLKLIDQYAFFYGEEGVRDEQEFREAHCGSEDEMGIRSLERIAQVRRFLVALFRLMGEYVDKTEDRLPRAFSRRAFRADRAGNIGNVTTLSLRRSIYGESESSTGRKITLAHLVRGHWRKQWYPSQQTHRAKWINAHRRGGNHEDKVVERHRVITVTQ